MSDLNKTETFVLGFYKLSRSKVVRFKKHSFHLKNNGVSFKKNVKHFDSLKIIRICTGDAEFTFF